MKKGKRILSLFLSVLLAFTCLDFSGIGFMQAKASNVIKLAYRFDDRTQDPIVPATGITFYAGMVDGQKANQNTWNKYDDLVPVSANSEGYYIVDVDLDEFADGKQFLYTWESTDGTAYGPANGYVTDFAAWYDQSGLSYIIGTQVTAGSTQVNSVGIYENAGTTVYNTMNPNELSFSVANFDYQNDNLYYAVLMNNSNPGNIDRNDIQTYASDILSLLSKNGGTFTGANGDSYSCYVSAVTPGNTPYAPDRPAGNTANNFKLNLEALLTDNFGGYQDSVVVGVFQGNITTQNTWFDQFDRVDGLRNAFAKATVYMVEDGKIVDTLSVPKNKDVKQQFEDYAAEKGYSHARNYVEGVSDPDQKFYVGVYLEEIDQSNQVLRDANGEVYDLDYFEYGINGNRLEFYNPDNSLYIEDDRSDYMFGYLSLYSQNEGNIRTNTEPWTRNYKMVTYDTMGNAGLPVMRYDWSANSYVQEYCHGGFGNSVATNTTKTVKQYWTEEHPRYDWSNPQPGMKMGNYGYFAGSYLSGDAEPEDSRLGEFEGWVVSSEEVVYNEQGERVVRRTALDTENFLTTAQTYDVVVNTYNLDPGVDLIFAAKWSNKSIDEYTFEGTDNGGFDGPGNSGHPGDGIIPEDGMVRWATRFWNETGKNSPTVAADDIDYYFYFSRDMVPNSELPLDRMQKVECDRYGNYKIDINLDNLEDDNFLCVAWYAPNGKLYKPVNGISNYCVSWYDYRDVVNSLQWWQETIDGMDYAVSSYSDTGLAVGDEDDGVKAYFLNMPEDDLVGTKLTAVFVQRKENGYPDMDAFTERVNDRETVNIPWFDVKASMPYVAHNGESDTAFYYALQAPFGTSNRVLSYCAEGVAHYEVNADAIWDVLTEYGVNFSEGMAVYVYLEDENGIIEADNVNNYRKPVKHNFHFYNNDGSLNNIYNDVKSEDNMLWYFEEIAANDYSYLRDAADFSCEAGLDEEYLYGWFMVGQVMNEDGSLEQVSEEFYPYELFRDGDFYSVRRNQYDNIRVRDNWVGDIRCYPITMTRKDGQLLYKQECWLQYYRQIAFEALDGTLPYAFWDYDESVDDLVVKEVTWDDIFGAKVPVSEATLYDSLVESEKNYMPGYYLEDGIHPVSNDPFYFGEFEGWIICQFEDGLTERGNWYSKHWAVDDVVYSTDELLGMSMAEIIEILEACENYDPTAEIRFSAKWTDCNLNYYNKNYRDFDFDECTLEIATNIYEINGKPAGFAYTNETPDFKSEAKFDLTQNHKYFVLRMLDEDGLQVEQGEDIWINKTAGYVGTTGVTIYDVNTDTSYIVFELFDVAPEDRDAYICYFSSELSVPVEVNYPKVGIYNTPDVSFGSYYNSLPNLTGVRATVSVGQKLYVIPDENMHLRFAPDMSNVLGDYEIETYGGTDMVVFTVTEDSFAESGMTFAFTNPSVPIPVKIRLYLDEMQGSMNAAVDGDMVRLNLDLGMTMEEIDENANTVIVYMDGMEISWFGTEELLDMTDGDDEGEGSDSKDTCRLPITVNPTQMTRDIKVVIENTNTGVATNYFSCSFRDYAQALLEAEYVSETEKEFIRAMLVFGSSAQKYFRYYDWGPDLADAYLYEDEDWVNPLDRFESWTQYVDQDIVSDVWDINSQNDEVIYPNGISLYGFSLSCLEQLGVSLYFKVDRELCPDAINLFDSTYLDSCLFVDQRNSYIRVNVPNLSVLDYSVDFDVTIRDEINESVSTYIINPFALLSSLIWDMQDQYLGYLAESIFIVYGAANAMYQ